MATSTINRDQEFQHLNSNVNSASHLASKNSKLLANKKNPSEKK